MWLNKKESSKGQRYFKIPEILRISRLLLFTKEVEFLVWGNPVLGKPFFNANKKLPYARHYNPLLITNRGFCAQKLKNFLKLSNTNRSTI